MPLYDCVLLLKPHVKKEAMADLVSRVGKHIFKRNGIVTEIKSFGTVQLGYGIKKIDGRYFQGQLLQMSMMATPNLNKELLYLNKEDRLLRWLLVKNRDVKFGMEYDLLADIKGRDVKSFELSLGDEVSDDDEPGNNFISQYDLGGEENPTQR